MQVALRTILYFEAIFFVILGMMAMALPYFFTTGIQLLLGALLITAGAVQLIRLLQHHMQPGFWPVLFSALLNLFLGGVLLFFPVVGVLTLTYLLIVYFIFDGAGKISYAFQIKPRDRWIWLLVSGLLSIVLSILIFFGLPEIAHWILGLLVGINLFFFGLSLFWMATAISE